MGKARLEAKTRENDALKSALDALKARSEANQGLQTSSREIDDRSAGSHTRPLFEPIPCRDDFALVAEKYFSKTGVAAEVGCLVGAFAAKNLKHWRKTYYMVDAWQQRPGDLDDKNEKDAVQLARMEQARRKTEFARSRR